MGEKLRRAINKNKSKFLVVIILWIVLAVVFVGPLSLAIMQKNAGANVISSFLGNISKPFTSLSMAIQADTGTFFTILLEFSVIYLVAMVVAIIRAWPKSEYDDIEHGSSDWCQGGEQYRILSPKAGIMLAEKNYLPLDKIGNTNVLVIRRVWSW